MVALYQRLIVLAAATGRYSSKVTAPDEDFVPLLVALAILGIVGVLLGATILQAAVSLHNKFAGGKASPGAVPEPSYLKAVGITLLAWIVALVVQLVVAVI